MAGESLTLRDGLNIVQAPNEWGKSTWCAFLRCMLYGVDSAQREKAGCKPDKLRYAPWSGAPMAGTMDILWRGESIQLRRDTRIPSAPMREFSASDASGNPLRGLTGRDVGEVLTGVSEPVFRRTAFISQGGLTVVPGADLDKKIAALVTAGEEDSSAAEAAERLRSWQRRRRWRSKGRLPEIETEQETIRFQLSSMEALQRELAELEEHIARTEEIQQKTSVHIRSEEFNRREEALVRLEKAQTRQQKLEETALLRRREAEERCRKLKEFPFGGEDPAQVERRAEADIAAAGEKPAPKWVGLLYALAFLLGAAAVVLSFFLGENRLFGVGLVLLSGCGLSGLFLFRHRHRRKKRIPPQLSSWGVSSAEELRQLLKGYTAQWHGARAAVRLARQVQQEAETAAREQQSIRRQLVAEWEQTGQGADKLSRCEEQLRLLREQQSALRTRLELMGDPLVLTSRLQKLTEERDRLESEYRALELAMQELEAANQKLQAEFSPLLTRRTAWWMKKLTGGRYSEVILNRELNALVHQEGAVLPREHQYLSRGTADQLYLALRLALCELLLNGEEPCPIVLDDALVAFDDERLGYAMEALLELSKTRQIILFTCQDREERYMNMRNKGEEQ